jgi:hypothetical protein
VTRGALSLHPPNSCIAAAAAAAAACRVNVPLKRLAEGSIEPSGAAATIPLMTQPSFGAALRGLRHAREALLQPWSTDVTPPKARVSVNPLLAARSCVPCTGVALHHYCVAKEGSCLGGSVLASSVIVLL